MSQSRGRAASRKNDSAVADTKVPTLDDIAKMSKSAIVERNKDPVIARLIEGLTAKIPQELTDAIETAERGRSLILSGLPESNPDMVPSAKQQDLEKRVSQVLDCLGVECRPVEVFRMGKSKSVVIHDLLS